MLHEPAAQDDSEDFAAEYKTKLGLKLFFVYGFIFAGFVAINTFSPAIMGSIFLFGLNFAIFYGVFLIVLAIILGVVYNALCTAKEKELNK